jgi:hypothetical protein
VLAPVGVVPAGAGSHFEISTVPFMPGCRAQLYSNTPESLNVNAAL